MSELLDHLGRDTLPRPMIEDFVRWCINEQARPALATVLKHAGFIQQAADVHTARSLQAMAAACVQAGRSIKQVRAETTQPPLAISAAEAAVFEFTNLMRAAADNELDAESLAFFSARLVGWAGWAAVNFADSDHKASAEANARHTQETQLRTLWQQYAAN